MPDAPSGTRRTPFSQPVPLQQRIRYLRRRLLLERFFFLAVIIGLLYLLVKQEQTGNAYELVAAQQPVALIKSEAAAKRVLEEFKRQRVPDIPDRAFFNPDVQILRVKREGRPLHSEEEAALALAKVVKVFAPGAAILANDRFVVGLRSKADAARCISELLKAYGPGKSTLKERVEITEVNLEASDRLPVDAAVRLLRTPAPLKTYIVQPGDAAWKIAQDAGISLATLRRLNPSVDLSALKPGSRIRLSDEGRRLTVITKRQVSRIEPIPYEIQIVPSLVIPRGQRRVARKGQTGERRIVEELTLVNGREVSRRLVRESIQKPPVDEIISVGKRSP